MCEYARKVCYVWLQDNFYAIGLEWQSECGCWISLGRSKHVQEDGGQFDLRDYHQTRFELYCLARELVYAGSAKVAFGLRSVHSMLFERCYSRATYDYALFYGVDVPLQLHGYTDADWAGIL